MPKYYVSKVLIGGVLESPPYSISHYGWVEDLVDKDFKAIGVYLALLYLRETWGYINIGSKGELSRVLDLVHKYLRELGKRYFIGRPSEAEDFVGAGRLFVERMFDHVEGCLNSDVRNRVLEDVEASFYKRFTSAFTLFIKLNVIPEDMRRKVRDFIKRLKDGVYTIGTPLTISGTITCLHNDLARFFKEAFNFSEDLATKFISYLRASRLIIPLDFRHNPSYLIPSTSFSDSVVRLLKVGEEVELKPTLAVKPLPPPKELEKFKPSYEVLEDIAESVFRDLGFSVQKRVKKEHRTTGASPIEVDVWAEKRVGEMKFSVYISCKNWSKEVGRPVVDEEFGRVLNLKDQPHLKVIIAKGFSRDAKKVALADGFLPIELGEKAEAENAVETYELVYKTLNDLFTSIAPPRLIEIVRRVSEIADELRKISEDLASLIKTRVSLEEMLEEKVKHS